MSVVIIGVREPAETGPERGPMRAGRERAPAAQRWKDARAQACGGCEEQVVANYEERCRMAPGWGCLFRARQDPRKECPRGRW